MAAASIWRISLSNLSRNLLEATELANVLQEVSSNIQVLFLAEEDYGTAVQLPVQQLSHNVSCTRAPNPNSVTEKSSSRG